MKAAVYEAFQAPLSLQNVADPQPGDRSVVIEVKATGLCRSDWHGWMGHDPDIVLPHVPGHELAGVVAAIGRDVKHWSIGDRVTTPFVCACGHCAQCVCGHQQVCDHQFQPGFSQWGSFAEYVEIDYADTNLVALDESISFNAAASLGCRFITAFRGIVDQGQLKPGQWLAIHGCGGVGLSGVMIASALGAQVIAIDVNHEALALAQSLGACAVLNASNVENVAEAVIDISDGGVAVSMDALGSQQTCFNSIANLRKRGRHIQVGLLPGQNGHPQIPMDRVIAYELEILGSHGMQAHRYPAMLEMIKQGRLSPERLIGRTISLKQSLVELPQMDQFEHSGLTIIDRF